MSPELALVLAEVDRFATRAIDPLAARHERPMEPRALEGILLELRALGVVPEGDAASVGLWDGEDDLSRSVRVLRRVARANAGVALAAHLESLARRIACDCGALRSGPGVAVVHGRMGVGREAFARWLEGRALDAGERALLEDVYSADGRRLVTAAEHAWVIAPAVDARGELGWSVRARADADVRVHARAHGFDELVTADVRAGAGRESVGGRAVMAGALVRASLGYVAIALGVLERAYDLARRYAATRVQGGAKIERHAAVQLLLASARGAIDAVEAQTEWLAREHPRDALRRALALRVEAHPLVTRGVNDALQVFGGLGYMRDTGVEKALRDVNHLRVMGASPRELALVASELERRDG